MKALIMAGGTGGHIFPAAAIAEQLVSEGFEVRWLGSERGMEGKLVPEMGYEFCALPVTAWHGGRLRKIIAPLNLLQALLQCVGMFRREKPDVVIGFGGYASAPGGFAAWLMNIPLVLHEQNGVPGLTNQKLEKKAAAVLQAFPDTFATEYETVGNPVRRSLCGFNAPSERGVAKQRKLKLLILGGSQGAASLNELVPQALQLLNNSEHFEVWHQCGKGKSEAAQSLYRELGIEATVVEFITDMEKAYRWCDLVLARSGASTVSELAAVGVYSILLPYPWHKDRQQYRNAHWLANADAAEWHEQEELTADKLAVRLQYWHAHRSELVEKAGNAWKIGIRDSAKRVVSVVKSLLKANTYDV